MLVKCDNKINELQMDQLETNKHLFILQDKAQKFELYFKLIYTLLEWMGGWTKP